MSDKQNIPGVPKGRRVREIYWDHTDKCHKAILEDDPKLKKRVQIAEWELHEGETVSGIMGLSYSHINSGDFTTNGQRTPDHVRIEERSWTKQSEED